MNRIETTWEFVKRQFEQSEFMAAHPHEREYRLEHTLRVTNIARRIAAQEELDAEALTIACLLHDISYIREFKNNEDWLNHGRKSAELVSPFVQRLRLPQETAKEICRAISIHADGQTDTEAQDSAFARTVGDADNIDRLGAWRIQDTLRQQKFEQLPLEERKRYLAQSITDYKALQKMELATKTAESMWQDCLEFRIHYFGRLYRQMELSEGII